LKEKIDSLKGKEHCKKRQNLYSMIAKLKKTRENETLLIDPE